MKNWAIARAILVIFTLQVIPLGAIPNTITDGVNRVNSPLNGIDLTERLLEKNLWTGDRNLPGKWKREAQIGESEVSHLLAKPKMFGLDVVLVRATHSGENLEEISITFADAGSYFPYLRRKSGETIEQVRERVLGRQKEFQKLYQNGAQKLSAELAKRSDGRVKKLKYGSSRTLRAGVTVYPLGKVFAVLYSNNNRLLKVSLCKDPLRFRKSWLDASRAGLSKRELSSFFQKHVKMEENGDVWLPAITTVPQGYRPYCGLNSLAMVGQYFGLHIDEDWMAVAGKFQNTGSAAGSNMLSLYNAVASEAKQSLVREPKFSYAKAKSLIRSGMPIIVWRRFDTRRDQFHSSFAKKFKSNGSLYLPLADQSDRSRWPSETHPVHASVIVGFNDRRKEILFLESWAGQGHPRRMRYQELEATATMAFYFKQK